MEYLFKKKLEKYQIEELQKRLPFLSEEDVKSQINYMDDFAYSISISSVSDINREEL